MRQEIIVRECESLDDFHRCVESSARFGEKQTWKSSRLPCLWWPRIPAAKCWALSMANAWWVIRSRSWASRPRALPPFSHDRVHSEYRDRGVGRMLKLFQRTEALAAESGSFNGRSIP